MGRPVPHVAMVLEVVAVRAVLADASPHRGRRQDPPARVQDSQRAQTRHVGGPGPDHGLDACQRRTGGFAGFEPFDEADQRRIDHVERALGVLGERFRQVRRRPLRILERGGAGARLAPHLGRSKRQADEERERDDHRGQEAAGAIRHGSPRLTGPEDVTHVHLRHTLSAGHQSSGGHVDPLAAGCFRTTLSDRSKASDIRVGDGAPGVRE
jgi:hypothetical protein